jgi:hypothetical protein
MQLLHSPSNTVDKYEFDCEGRLRTHVYNDGDDFKCPIVDFP